MTFPSFSEFFQSLHGFEPFPWQRRLAQQVVNYGWPDVLSLPTGSGKTCVLDIALYALAVVPERAPRRMFLVVDRRIVVDQGAIHARTVRDRIDCGHAHQVARRLRALFGGSDGDPPFEIAVLRGGIPREEEWARRPDQPVVGVSTVDQVGSRLLFRGYGVSRRMAPVHAGLLGNDTLFFLDEVHLAQPFAETLAAIETRWRSFRLPAPPDDTADGRWWHAPATRRFKVVRMSATPGAQAGVHFGLNDEDISHPVLGRRLAATKRAALRCVAVDKKDDERDKLLCVAEHCADEARSFLRDGARVVGVVVNRVETARAAWRQLQASLADEADVVLLTGRMRPLDRDALLFGPLRVLSRAGAQQPREERPCPRPLVVVATQCIEAGADLDLDALVTECASLDALRQRFGRLDRRGDLGMSRAVVLIRTDQTKAGHVDPVYGKALSGTWSFLVSHAQGAEIDFGIREMDRLLEQAGVAPVDLAPEPKCAPVLLPAHLDSWAQTSQPIHPDPDVSLWLHGPTPHPADVQIIWRADVTEEALARAADGSTDALDDLVDQLMAVRPRALEAVSVPLYAARAWLRQTDAPAIDDAVGSAGTEADDFASRNARSAQHALRWLGDEESEVVEPNRVRPGDTLIVPATRGGLSGYNWDPGATEPVIDLGDVAQYVANGRPTVRTHPDALRAWSLNEAHRNAAPRIVDGEETDELEQRIAEWLDELPASIPDGRAEWAEVLAALRRGLRILPLPGGTFALHARTAVSPDTTTEDDDSSFIEREVTLRRHSADVERWVRQFAANLGLDPAIESDIALAARLHDLGKADPRFQRWLVDGNPFRASLLTEPLAKSAGSGRDRASRERARRRAGYPRGYRHELLSVAMAQNSQALLGAAHDPDLVLHLVGSHHGWCRPLAPPEDHPDDAIVSYDFDGTRWEGTTRHRLASVDSGVADRYWRLTERYGWWGLAWMEAIVRLADHRASEEEVRQ